MMSCYRAFPAWSRCGSHSGRGDAGHAREQNIIARSVGAPRGVPGVQMAQLHAENRGLHFVEPAVPALLFTEVFPAFTVTAKRTQALREFLGVRENHSAVAVCAQILGRVEAETA